MQAALYRQKQELNYSGFKMRYSVVILLVLFSSGEIMAQAPTPVITHKPVHDTIKTIKETPEQSAKVAYNKGLSNFLNKQYDSALANFNRAIAGAHKFEPAYLARANTRLREKDYTNAANDYQTTLKLDSNDEKAWYGLGQAEIILGKDSQAMLAFNHFVKKNSASGDAWYCLGELQARAKNYKDALTDFTLAIGSKPNFPEAYNDRGVCNYELGNYHAAIDDYRQSIAFAKTAATYNNLGNAESKSGNNDEAIMAFSTAITIDPKYTSEYNNRGIEYLNKKSDTNALNDFNEAIQLDSTNTDAYCNRALVEYHMNNMDKAKADCDKAIKLNPQYGIAYLDRGIIEEMMRKAKAACTNWQKAAEYGIVVANDYTKDCK